MELLSMLRCPREPTGISGEPPRDWITEKKLFFSLAKMATNTTVQGNRDEPFVTAEKREFVKSMQIEWQGFGFAQEPNSQGSISGRNGPSSNVLTRSCDGQSFGAHLEVRRKTDPDAPNIESHSMTFTCECQ